ncbi:hypothetical protein WMF21_33360 [Sorangium sp. So ce1099]
MRPAFLHASIISTHSADVLAIGFSQSTCLPAWAARSVYSWCMLFGSTM